MPEKTYPVNVGEDVREMILEIQERVKALTGYDVTQRSIVTRAIKKFHEDLSVPPSGETEKSHETA